MAYSIKNDELDKQIEQLEAKANKVARWTSHVPSPGEMWKILGALKELKKHRQAQTPRD
jgi:hypothetical protein